MMIRTAMILLIASACGGKSHSSSTTTAKSEGGCPAAVTGAVTKAYPDATQSPCESEHEDGKDVFEVKITKKDGSKAELELMADGTINGMEEVVATMPDAVAKAFAAKYPGATASRIEKVTMTGKAPMYEVKLEGKEATFKETGEFVEEEGGGEEGEDKEDKD